MSRYRQWEVTGDAGLLIPSGALSLPPYSTTFSGGNANPISESGAWAMHGNTTGLDWADCAITGGIAHGKHVNEPFSDPTALLGGTWSPDQEAEGIIQGVDSQGSCNAEVELRLRSLIAPDVNQGYELLWSTRTSSNYAQWVRWNGLVGDFTELGNWNAPATPVNGRMLRGRVTGVGATVTLTWWIIDTDGSTILATDTITDTDAGRWVSGNPGMGFWIGTSCLTDLSTEHLFGFTAFAAREVA